MNNILIYISLFLSGLATKQYALSSYINQQRDISFKLRFMTVGFGSNMFEMEPVFTVSGTNFVYTSEEVWVRPNQKIIQKDTLLIGQFRASSIDSISNFINSLQDTVIQRTNMHVMSGSACYLEISNDIRKITFELHNISDTTADKIVAILNSYIPKGIDKLYISNFKTKQN